MKFIHYTDKKFDLQPRNYVQQTPYWKNKPPGLWVSVKGENDWKSWCEAEHFNVERLAVSYEVILKENAKILFLKTREEILNLCNQYPYLKPQWDDPAGKRLCKSNEIDWEKMQREYQGIIITPYQWECRLDNDCNWYYGWDCASGCIWNIECIEEFKLIESL